MKTKFGTYLKAAYPILYVQTSEEGRAMAKLTKESEGYAAWSWDVITGLTEHATGAQFTLGVINVATGEIGLVKVNPANPQQAPIKDPLKMVTAAGYLPPDSILFLKDFHRWIKSIEIIRTMKILYGKFKNSYRHLVIISPVLEVPVELEKDITIYDFELPTVAEITKVAENIIKENDLNFTVEEKDMVAAKGLTLQEVENEVSRSIIGTGQISRKIIEEGKLQTIRKSGLMEIYEPVSEEELGGLENLKDYFHDRLNGFHDPAIPQIAKPTGVLFVGPPGSGKSLAAKIVASVLELPMVRLDVAALKGGLVGATEANTKKAWAILKAVAPVVVFMDEIEKGFGGVQSSNRTDGGSGSASFGLFLTEMQEAADAGLGIYFVATCNDISDLLALSTGAFLRRFDDVFFVDIPSDKERKHILRIMNRRFGTSYPEALTEQMENWTGAEIQKFAKAAIYEGPDAAIKNMRPIYLQNQEQIEKARKWASYNARLANRREGNGEEKEAAVKGRRLRT